MECNNQRIRAEEKVKNLQQEREDKDSLVNRLKDDIVSSNLLIFYYRTNWVQIHKTS